MGASGEKVFAEGRETDAGEEKYLKGEGGFFPSVKIYFLQGKMYSPAGAAFNAGGKAPSPYCALLTRKDLSFPFLEK